MIARAWWLLWIAALSVGCTPPSQILRRRAASDLSCPQAELSLQRIDQQTYKVIGCSTSATYVSTCGGYMGANCTWILNSNIKEGAPTVAQTSGPSDVGLPRDEAYIESARDKDGSTKLRLFMKSDHWTLYIAATPRTDGKVATVVWRVPKTFAREECEIKLVADGERVALGQDTQLISRQRSYDYQTTMPYESLLTLAKSSRVAGRLCSVEATLSESQLGKVRELVVRIREEHAWDEEPVRSPDEAEAAPTEL